VDWTSNVAVHESAAPEFLREQVLAALRQGRVHPHLLYSGLRQASLWTALHHAISPAQQDESCAAIYAEAFASATSLIKGNVAHVVSLACGDGSKDARCLRQIRGSGRAAMYSPVDVSLDLALRAARHASREFRGLQPTPLICDLSRCSVLPAILKGFDPSGAERVVLFLGTIHNFWPPDILKAVSYPVRAQDQLLLSANLAPAGRYDAALEDIVKQYDNGPTREWLMGALSELRLGNGEGALAFTIESASVPELKRIEARFTLKKSCAVQLYGERVELGAGQQLVVFFSHRFTPMHIAAFAQGAGLAVAKSWIAAGEQEGLFLCRRAPQE
jgi:uncharacterized SAM-dependent methyltransferase